MGVGVMLIFWGEGRLGGWWVGVRGEGVASVINDSFIYLFFVVLF